MRGAGGLVERATNPGDDVGLKFGAGGPVELKYNVDDANANALMLLFSEGGAVDVPVFVLGDVTADKDLGWYNGVVEPQLAIVDDDGDSAVGLGFNADDDARIILKGSGVLTLPAVTLGGTVTLNGQSFDAGAGTALITSTGAQGGLQLQVTNDGVYGVVLHAYQNSASPLAGDRIFELIAYGEDSGGTQTLYGRYSVRIVSPTDTSESAEYVWEGISGGSNNVSMKLQTSGVLSVDVAGSGSAAQVDLFDQYDDALVLKQGIQLNNRELLADIGILTRKDTGSGYMMNLQPMVRLLAGGIYQTRQMLEDKIAELEDRLIRAGI